jgi:hypothetical protein
MEQHENRKNKGGRRQFCASLLGNISVLYLARITQAIYGNIIMFNEFITKFHGTEYLELKKTDEQSAYTLKSTVLFTQRIQ